jgi:hypothetical protein
MANLYKLQDPTKQYPAPRFKHQPQNAPGLAKKMSPRPDHGETSYVGSGRLPNRKALVTGGDSGIGRAAAIAFAREGADVAISYLPSEEADAKEVIALIEKEGRKAVAIPGDIRSESFCKKLVSQAHRKLGGLDILALVAGKQHAVEKISDITTKQLEETYEVNVFALFCCTSPDASRRLDHHYGIYSSDPSESFAPRLRPNQSSDSCIHSRTGAAGCRRRHQSELRSPGTRLDATSDQWWTTG